MKKILLFSLPVLALTLLSGCNGNGGNQSSNTLTIVGENKDVISLDFTSKSLLIYTDFQITVYGKEISSVTWSSSDNSVASVDEGCVIGLKEGVATIEAFVNQKEKLTCSVTVNNLHITPYIMLNVPSETINLEVNDKFTLKPTISYNGLTYEDASFTFLSNGNSIKVDEKGLITALELGESSVTVSAKWRGNETIFPVSLGVNVL